MKVWGLVVEPDFKALGGAFPVEVKSSDSIHDVKIKARRVSKKPLASLNYGRSLCGRYKAICRI
jgi:hypothetical protein